MLLIVLFFKILINFFYNTIKVLYCGYFSLRFCLIVGRNFGCLIAWYFTLGFPLFNFFEYSGFA